MHTTGIDTPSGRFIAIHNGDLSGDVTFKHRPAHAPESDLHLLTVIPGSLILLLAESQFLDTLQSFIDARREKLL